MGRARRRESGGAGGIQGPGVGTGGRPGKRRAGEPGGQDAGARERLLASAIALFNRKGYAATTVREIVADAGVTKPVLYYYFGNKQGIFLELMKGAWARFESLLAELAGRRGGARERIRTLAERIHGLFVENIEVARLMYAVYYGPRQGAPFFDFEPYHRRFRETVRGLVEEGIRSGEFRAGDADDMAWALIGAVNVAMELELCEAERGIGPAGLNRVLDIIFAGLSRAPRARRATERRRA